MASRQLLTTAIKAPNLHSFAANSHKNVQSYGLLRGIGCTDGKTFLHPDSHSASPCYRPLHQSQHQSEMQTQSFGQKQSRLISAMSLHDPACKTHSHGQNKASTGNFSTSSKQLGDGHSRQPSETLAVDESDVEWWVKFMGTVLLGSYVMRSLYRRKVRNDLTNTLEVDNLHCMPDDESVENTPITAFEDNEDMAAYHDDVGESESCSMTSKCLEPCPQPPCEPPQPCPPAAPPKSPSLKSSSLKSSSPKLSSPKSPPQNKKQVKVNYSCQSCENGKKNIPKIPCVNCPPPAVCQDPGVDDRQRPKPMVGKKGRPRTEDVYSGKGQQKSTKHSSEGLDDDDYLIL